MRPLICDLSVVAGILANLKRRLDGKAGLDPPPTTLGDGGWKMEGGRQRVLAMDDIMPKQPKPSCSQAFPHFWLHNRVYNFPTISKRPITPARTSSDIAIRPCLGTRSYTVFFGTRGS
jgi:hypothetical protein